MTENNQSGVSRRGFASMSEEKQREIASKGGKTAHLKGTAHEWSSEEAKEAGRRGGQHTQAKRRKDRNNDDSPDEGLQIDHGFVPRPA